MPIWVSGIEPHLFDSAPMAQLINDSDHLPREKQELTLLALSSMWNDLELLKLKTTSWIAHSNLLIVCAN